MSSEPKLLRQAYRHIQRIKAGDYPVILGASADHAGGYRIVERPWQELRDPPKD
jgi:hypothetical protein